MKELVQCVNDVGKVQSSLSTLRKSLFELQQAMDEHGDKASIEAVHVYVGLVLAMKAISGQMFAGFKMGADVAMELRKMKEK